MLPRERRLTSDQEGHVQRLMKMKDNKKEVRKVYKSDWDDHFYVNNNVYILQIMFLSGHPVLLKDINNIVAKGKMNQTRNQLESAVTLLQDIYGIKLRSC